MIPMLNQTISTLEAEIAKIRRQSQSSQVSSSKRADDDARLKVGMQVIIRRYNGQLCDAYIEDLHVDDEEGGDDVCLIRWAHPRSRSELICKFWQKGSCRRGHSCNFSHGVIWKKEELQPIEEAIDEGLKLQQIPYGDQRCPQVGERVLALYFNDGGKLCFSSASLFPSSLLTHCPTSHSLLL